MRRYSPFYFIGQAFKGLFRNGVMSLASILVLISCLVVMGGFAALVANLNTNLENIGLMNEIVVFLQYDMSDEEIDQMTKKLDGMSEQYNFDYLYISKEDGLREMQQKYAEYGDIYNQISDEDNPLAASYKITYYDNDQVNNLDYQLRHMEEVRKVNNRIDLANQIESFKNGVSLIFVWFLVILFVVSIFVIINTIKLGVYARRDEISVMRYVGSTRWFIITPFVLEGIIIGLLSSVVAYFIEEVAYGYIEKMIGVDVQMIQILPFESISNVVLTGFILIGVLTGIVGSFISLQKHVEV